MWKPVPIPPGEEVEMLAVAMGLREGGYRGHITAGGHFATFAAEDLLRDHHAALRIARGPRDEPAHLAAVGHPLRVRSASGHWSTKACIPSDELATDG